MTRTAASRRKDPFDLDKSPLADALRKRAKNPQAPGSPEPEHPLRKDEGLAGIADSLDAFFQRLAKERGIGSSMSPDVYFDDDLHPRTEVVVRAFIETVLRKGRDNRRRERSHKSKGAHSKNGIT